MEVRAKMPKGDWIWPGDFLSVFLNTNYIGHFTLLHVFNSILITKQLSGCCLIEMRMEAGPLLAKLTLWNLEVSVIPRQNNTTLWLFLLKIKVQSKVENLWTCKSICDHSVCCLCLLILRHYLLMKLFLIMNFTMY